MSVFFALSGFVLLLYLAQNSQRLPLLWLSAVSLYAVWLVLGLRDGFPSWSMGQIPAQGLSPAWHWQLHSGKLIVGLILLGFLWRSDRLFARPSKGTADKGFDHSPSFSHPLALMLLILLLLAVTLLLAQTLDFIRLQFSPPPFWPLWLLANLLLTVLPEEILFRGYLQNRLERLGCRYRYGWLPGWLAASALFALAHAGGGLIYMLLSFCAGLCYGLAWHFSHNLLWPVLAHFSLNAVHFLAFSYPYLSQPPCLTC